MALLLAYLLGRPYPPPDVPDTARNRALWAEITAAVDDLACRGVIPDVPPD